jgi:RNA recognition motif-containing protein
METKPKKNTEVKLTALYVGGLAYSRTPHDIKRLFSNYGKVHSVKIVTDPKDPKRKKGYAFVFMTNVSEAHKAIKALNLKTVDDRTLKVSIAKPLKNKEPSKKDRFEADDDRKSSSKKTPEKKPIIKRKRSSGLDELLTFLKSKK